jgi:hypothetical protein
MKNFVKLLCLAGIVGVCSLPAQAKKAKTVKKNAVYVFGVSASFTDSLVYFTEVQLLDSVKLGKKEMLPERPHYSQQLKDYLEGQEGLENRTCFVYYNRSEAKLKKQSAQLKAKYQKNNSKLLLRQVNPNAFRFTKPDDDE